jgi:hypothetical protein
MEHGLRFSNMILGELRASLNARSYRVGSRTDCNFSCMLLTGFSAAKTRTAYALGWESKMIFFKTKDNQCRMLCINGTGSERQEFAAECFAQIKKITRSIWLELNANEKKNKKNV